MYKLFRREARNDIIIYYTFLSYPPIEWNHCSKGKSEHTTLIMLGSKDNAHHSIANTIHPQLADAIIHRLNHVKLVSESLYLKIVVILQF